MKRIIPLACIGVLALSACFHDSPLTDVQRLAGLAPPAETPEDQFARAPDLLARSDSLISSTIYGETDSPAFPAYRLLAECSGPQCTLTDPDTGGSVVLGISDLQLVNDGTEALGTKYGVTLMAMATRFMDLDVTTFAARMDHSSFSVQFQRGMAQGITIDVRKGIAYGILTGDRPTGSATWRGLMVGRPATGESRGDRLLGDAALSYDMDAAALDARFTDIVNIERGAAHSTPTVTFSDIALGADGTFAHGEAGDRIQGGLYGPEHAETAGIFEKSNIVGAFGAKRQ